METIFNRLKSNYLFQASLGSKELFHSNLLAWLLEQKDINGKYIALQEFLKQFTDFNQTDFFDEVIIAREELNIDLTIKYKVENQWYLVFIENKMKSIPSINQLDEYDKKIEKLMPRYKCSNETIQKILLTPLTPRLINNLSLKESSWKSITYQKDILFFLKSYAFLAPYPAPATSNAVSPASRGTPPPGLPPGSSPGSGGCAFTTKPIVRKNAAIINF